MLHTFIIAVMAFFAITNPVVNLSVFLAITSEYDNKTTKQIAFRACAIAFVILAIFSVFGHYIFMLFGISLYALSIAGGIIIGIIGFKMLQGSPSHIQHPVKSNMDPETLKKAGLNLAITPLATPMIAGPGAIATTMTLASHGDYSIGTTIAGFSLIIGITYILYIYGKNLIKHLGDAALTIITRMMGLILAVIGVQMVISGIDIAFPILHMTH
ncbi:MAG: MarC family protein [Psittacicella sp.]